MGHYARGYGGSGVADEAAPKGRSGAVRILEEEVWAGLLDARVRALRKDILQSLQPRESHVAGKPGTAGQEDRCESAWEPRPGIRGEDQVTSAPPLRGVFRGGESRGCYCESHV